jgi:hypothetical protein
MPLNAVDFESSEFCTAGGTCFEFEALWRADRRAFCMWGKDLGRPQSSSIAHNRAVYVLSAVRELCEVNTHAVRVL